jgi:molecular chaperone Hsp33
MPDPAADSILRSMTDDGSFRVITARTTRTVQDAIDAQGAADDVAESFADLLTGTIIVREAMAPMLRVQGILKHAAGGSLIADSHPGGMTRGLVNFGAAKRTAPAATARGSLLQMMRTMPSGAIHQGVVEVPEDGGISAGLMTYMQESEQVVSMIAVATVLDAGRVTVAGGYLVQLLPEAQRGPLMIMTERLAGLPSLAELLLSHDASPRALVEELLHAMPFTLLEQSPVTFGCRCSELRLLETLATLPRADIADLAQGDEPLEIRCEYCGKQYAIAPTRLQALLTAS